MNIHAAVCFIYFALLSITSFDDSHLCSGNVIESRLQIPSVKNEVTISRSKRLAIGDYRWQTECNDDIERLCGSRVRSGDVLSVLECFENTKVSLCVINYLDEHFVEQLVDFLDIIYTKYIFSKKCWVITLVVY